MAGMNVVFDCADPGRVALFWLTALPGYTYPGSPKGDHGGPPEGFESWEAWADANQIPEELRNQGRTIIDEEGDRPDIHFIRVPEPKSGKNRLHLDVKVGRGLEGQAKRERQEAEAARLVAAGATMVRRVEDHTGTWLVMRDVEDNEFCLI
jgi:hypothetical protein